MNVLWKQRAITTSVVLPDPREGVTTELLPPKPPDGYRVVRLNSVRILAEPVPQAVCVWVLEKKPVET